MIGLVVMIKACATCGKGAQFGRAIAHSKKHSRRRFKPNFQKWQGKWFCASCLKRLKHPAA